MKSRPAFGALNFALAEVWVLAALAMPSLAQVTSRMSVDPAGVQGNDWNFAPAISADGRYIAFQSRCTNLVSGDSNGVEDIYVKDRITGAVDLVSVDSSGAQGNEHSSLPSISADGRFVSFFSEATNLVAGDTNGVIDVFVRDRLAGTTERVSVDSGGAQGNHGSGGNWPSSISGDGRFVAFHSLASNLVHPDTNLSMDAFVRDRVSGTTELVSVAWIGAQAAGSYRAPWISRNGRYVVFSSSSSSLVSGGTNGRVHVFVRDRVAGTTELVSVNSNEEQGSGTSVEGSISDDGRFVAFQSNSINLVDGIVTAGMHVLVRDRAAGTTDLVSVDSTGGPGNGGSESPVFSPDGRHIAFESNASNLVSGDTNGKQDAFVRDLVAGTTERLSLSSSGVQGNGHSVGAHLSSDGRLVAFQGHATTLVAGDTNAVPDIFVRDRDATGFESLCHPGIDGVIGCPCGQPSNPAGGCANFGAGATSGAVLSASGVAYLSSDTLLLTTSNHRTPAIGVLNVFFSYKLGAVTTGVASGAGVRCTDASGSLRRLYTLQVLGGAGSKPGMGDPSVSARSAAIAGHSIAPGETRYYFNVYRDGQAAGPCGSTATSTNLTNLGSIEWSP